ncbi:MULTISPECIES: EpsG family protein [Chromobacterium]|uniref:EpsG family protein n=1 Tax=Chromobacterium TaxID=535 RepID=UPI001D06D9AD|nr:MULTISPECIES: EpsG family protein [Chromobacterium]MCP1289061.1 EpsG family protein [Chromobacterium sp. S0633]
MKNNFVIDPNRLHQSNFLLVIFLVAIVSLPMAFNGVFADSDIYYSQSQLLWTMGLRDGIEYIFFRTGKVEIGFLIVLYLEQYIANSEFIFIFINCLISNILFFQLYIKLSETSSITFKKAFILFFCYFSFSNAMYVWRTIISVYFLVLSIKSNSKLLSILFLAIAFSFHYSAIIFVSIYLLSTFLPNKKTLTVLFAIFLSLSFFFTESILQSFDFVMSAQSAEIYTEANNDQWKRIFIGLYLLFVILLCDWNSSNFKHIHLFKFCAILSILSVFASSNYQLSWRIHAPVEIIAPCLVLATQRSNRNSILLLALSTIPTFRLMFLLFTGHFE